MQTKVSLSLLSEVTGLDSLFIFTGMNGIITYLLFHAGASFLIGSATFFLLPQKYRSGTNKKLLITLLTLMVFSTGPLGVISGVFFYFMLLKKKSPSLPVEKLFTEEVIFPEVEQRKLGEAIGSLPNERLILFLTKFPTAQTVKTLKKALSTKDDELRLLAFSVLSKMEKDIFERINLLLKELDKTGNSEETFRIYSSLAELYWEPVFLGIADKELEEFYLNTALDYCLKALSIKEEGKIFFLTGRIYLRLKNYEKAEEFLRKAVERGMPVEKVAPYLIEVYFVKRDWEALIKLSSFLKDSLVPDARALSIIKVWL